MNETFPTIRAAAVQAEPVVLDREATVEKARQLIGEAANNGAQLIVFPEAFIPTYVNSVIWGRGLSRFGATEAKQAWVRLWRESVQIPGPSTDALGKAAREAGATVVIGLNERVSESRTLYNTILYIGPDGNLIGKHRKLVPTHHERLVWGRGDGSTLQVFDTPAGKIGGLICWENWMPLARYALYGQGEEIHLAPHADDRDEFLLNVRHTAIEGGVFVISACMILNKASYPADFELQEDLQAAPDALLVGGSAIVGPDGGYLAKPLWNEEGILYADLDLSRTLEAKQLLDVTGHYARPDVLQLRFNAALQAVIEQEGASAGFIER